MATTTVAPAPITAAGLGDMLKRYNETRQQPTSDRADEMALRVGLYLDRTDKTKLRVAMRGPVGLNVAVTPVEGVSLLGDLVRLFNEHHLLRELTHEDDLRRTIGAYLRHFGRATILVDGCGRLRSIVPVSIETLD